MVDWTAGYVADIGYTFGYYQELNPLRVRMAFLYAGLKFPDIGAACELGFGQGVSANIHAAASVVKWRGTDFNPSQASFAKELAKTSGADIQLFDDAFTEFAARDDLPEFDYIGLHGIWSWISDDNRKIIVDFVRRKLKVGGVLYISYNTLPGWSVFAPMRHLMTQHAEVIGADGHGIVSRINGALEFAERLIATEPAYARVNPQVAERLMNIKGQHRNYVAHEYFNKDWHPMHFATIAEWLRPAKVSYACSAHFLDHIDTLNFTPDQQIFLKEIPDATLRETVKDFMTNQQFRRDYWVKGGRTLLALERSEELRSLSVVLVSHRPDISLKVNGALGEATMSDAVYTPVLEYLADHNVKTIGEIEHFVRDKGITFAQLLEAIMVLTSMGHTAPVQSPEPSAVIRMTAERLNANLLNRARGSGEVAFLASPVTGGGVAIGRFPQIFLLAYLQGKKDPTEWASFAVQILAAQGQKIVKDGKTLESVEETMKELTSQAQSFLKKQIPILRALQIV